MPSHTNNNRGTRRRPRNNRRVTSRGPQPPQDQLQTITIQVEEGNNLISFPYKFSNNDVDVGYFGTLPLNTFQELNPNVRFSSMTGTSGEGPLVASAGIFDLDNDGFMEAGNLTTIQPYAGYWLNIEGNDDSTTDIINLNIPILPHDFSEQPLRYNLLNTNPENWGGNRLMSYDGDDDVNPIDALGARGAFVQYIIGNGLALFNDCLENWFEEYFDFISSDDYQPDKNFGFGGIQNPGVPDLPYHDGCWSGNLTRLKRGNGYWINLYVPAGQSTGGETDHVPSNVYGSNGLYAMMGKEPPFQTSSWVTNFINFEWLRPVNPPPKTIMRMSKSEVVRKIVKEKVDNQLVGLKPRKIQSPRRRTTKQIYGSQLNFGE